MHTGIVCINHSNTSLHHHETETRLRPTGCHALTRRAKQVPPTSPTLCANPHRITASVRKIAALHDSPLEPHTKSATIPTMQTANRFVEYDFNAAFPTDQPEATKAAPSPTPADEASEPGSQIRPWRNTGEFYTNTPTLTNALMHDLLDPTVSTLQLCDYHNLTLPQLIAITHSDEFAYFKAALKHMSAERKDLIDHEARYTAAAALKDIASQRPESDRHTETIRKAAAALHHREPQAHPEPSQAYPKPSKNQKAAPANESRPSSCSAERSSAKDTPAQPPTNAPDDLLQQILAPPPALWYAHTHQPREGIAMNFTTARSVCLSIAMLVSGAYAQPLTESFTYQGELVRDNQPANGTYEFAFALYTAQAGGTVVPNGSVFVPAIDVADGRFSVFLDFDTANSVFNTPETLWLEIRVREEGDVLFETLSPRQRISPAPVANHARNAAIAAGADQSFDLLSDSGSSILQLAQDIDIGGGVLLSIPASSAGPNGILIDANRDASNSPSIEILGEQSFFTIRTDLAGDASTQLAPNAISASEILDEPGVAETELLFFGQLSPASIDTIGTTVIDAPAPGYILAMATTQVTFQHTLGTTTAGIFGLAVDSQFFPSNTDKQLRLSANLPSGAFNFPITVHALFPVSQGLHSVNFLGAISIAGNNIEVADTQITAVYLPTNYGSVSRDPPAASLPVGSTHAAPTPARLDAIEAENAALRTQTQRQQSELDELRAKLDAVLQDRQKK